MSQVSRRLVRGEIQTKMYETLFESISKLKSRQEIIEFLNDLFSPVERTMIAKRLAIAAFLARNYDYQTISDLLKVSSTTISKVSLTLNYNTGYKNVINKIALSEANRKFWQEIENLLLRAGNAKYTFASDEAIRAKLKHKSKTLL